MKRVLATALACVAMCAVSAFAHAQSWPAKPVKVLVGFPAGTSSDIIARLYTERLADHFKQSFVVENMPGAASSKAAGIAAAAEPDGYTMFLGTAANSISQSVYKKLRFEFATDMIAVATLGSTPVALVVSPDLPVKSVSDLIAYAKTKPDKLFYASAGVGTTPHLAAEMFNQMAGIKLIHVPYKGTNEAISDLLGGRIHVNFSPVTTAAELIKAGQVKGLAVGSAKRSSLAPDLPTLAEAGVAGFDAVIWYGFHVPKGTPRAIVDSLHAAIGKAATSPEMKTRLAANGADPLSMSVDEFNAYVRNDVAKWRKIVEAAGVSVE